LHGVPYQQISRPIVLVGEGIATDCESVVDWREFKVDYVAAGVVEGAAWVEVS
jgi:hypothetical protein